MLLKYDIMQILEWDLHFFKTHIGHQSLNRFCFIVEQIGHICNAGIAGYVKLQRQARCRQENKIYQETTQKKEVLNFLWSNDRFGFNFGCGGSTRTNDLQVMSLASYQLLHSAMLICYQHWIGALMLLLIQKKRLTSNEH